VIFGLGWVQSNPRLPPNINRELLVLNLTSSFIGQGPFNTAFKPETHCTRLVDGIAGQSLHDFTSVLPIPKELDCLFLGGYMPLTPEVSKFLLTHGIKVWDHHAQYYA
jgi:hypothetical protein